MWDQSQNHPFTPATLWFEFSLNLLKTWLGRNLILFIFSLLLHEHPLHLKTFTSSKRSRFVLVQDYSSPVRKQEASRFNVSEGSQSLRVTWLFALGCRKTFQLSPKIKTIIWDAFRIKGETSVRRYKYTMQSSMSRHWRAAESVLFLFSTFFATGNFRKDKRKKPNQLYRDAQTAIFSPAVTTEIWK